MWIQAVTKLEPPIYQIFSNVVFFLLCYCRTIGLSITISKLNTNLAQKHFFCAAHGAICGSGGSSKYVKRLLACAHFCSCLPAGLDRMLGQEYKRLVWFDISSVGVELFTNCFLSDLEKKFSNRFWSLLCSLSNLEFIYSGTVLTLAWRLQKVHTPYALKQSTLL